jgi:hypothetical protein
MKVLIEKFPYRYIETETLLENGKPDCRMEKFIMDTKRYREIYKFDNQMQMMLAIEDFEYSKWLDPDGVPCYVRDKVTNPNK